ncbi:P-loop containing nucleoside triphosphate hydrolase protein [Mycena albidolilacea]|uniref:ATP-dependent DNA helicase n=1 Tax=Mycena albidolilacea TaxID=1033008 RepID=A0AAD7F5E9_9AGAR|nr:P-loop containing nucleoside triphosphate hydrolase protein [Mycena albidolilacea]
MAFGERVFRLDRFRENQLDIIAETIAGRDTVVLMSTGAGKSLCFQLPAVYESERNGRVTIVVSPLVALIRDQVDALKAKGVHAIGLTPDNQEWLPVSKPALVYVTPEKLCKSSFLRDALSHLYRDGNLARFAIDEAHCISTWGHDFRDSYRGLNTIRTNFPDVPIMALTGTADSEILEDIVRGLKLERPKIVQQSFNRPNLHYSVEAKRNEDDVVEFIQNRHSNERGIVYCTRQRACTHMAERLTKNGIHARPYHAGLDVKTLASVHSAWKTGEIYVIVATVAFGLGIDQPDVRFVLHYDLPKSLSNYYQETGRAGRDGFPAECVLCKPPSHSTEVLPHSILDYRFQDLKNILDLEPSNRSPEESLVESRARRENAARPVVRYCEEKAVCRRVQLLHHFGEDFEEENCKGHCDNCSGYPVSRRDLSREARSAVNLVKSFNFRDNITVKQFIAILRGSDTTETRKYQGTLKPEYGSGQELSLDIAEMLFDRLLYLEVFMEKRVEMAGHHHYYLKPGLRANDFLAQNWKLDLTFKDRTPAPAGKAQRGQTISGHKRSHEVENDEGSRGEPTISRANSQEISTADDPPRGCDREDPVKLYRKLTAHRKKVTV